MVAVNGSSMVTSSKNGLQIAAILNAFLLVGPIHWRNLLASMLWRAPVKCSATVNWWTFHIFELGRLGIWAFCCQDISNYASERRLE